MSKTFIESHCHLFNMVDIPLFSTIKNEIPMNTIQRLIGIFALTAVPTNILRNQIDYYEDMIRFFERDIEANIEWLTKQIENAIAPDIDNIILTPLIMDFDMISNSGIGNGEPTVEKQLTRLQQAISNSKISNKFKICPFLGFDLRKTTMQEIENLKRVWNENCVSREKRKSIETLESGKVLGIKLYPPMGFNPYPDHISKKAVYFEFYKWCCQEDIPLTVHCLEASYTGGNSQKEVSNFTHPANWLKVLNEKQHDFSNLNINFAHFGGDDELEDMFNPVRRSPNRINKSTWTYDLIQILKNYPNTFADISSYDFSSNKARRNFVKLLNTPQIKFGNGKYSLTDKILWGSDVPMILPETGYQEKKHFSYKKLLNFFTETVNKYKHIKNEDLITKFTNTNPTDFLTVK